MRCDDHHWIKNRNPKPGDSEFGFKSIDDAMIACLDNPECQCIDNDLLAGDWTMYKNKNFKTTNPNKYNLYPIAYRKKYIS